MPGPSPCVCPQGGLISGLCRQCGVVDRGHLPRVGGRGPHLYAAPTCRGALCHPVFSFPGGPVVTKNPGLFPPAWGIKANPRTCVCFDELLQAAVCLENQLPSCREGGG